MPTFTKLVAGLSLALTAYVAAYVFSDANPDLQATQRFPVGNAAVGFLVGWFSLGQRPGKSLTGAVVTGLRSIVVLVLVSAITFGLWFVLRGMLKGSFNEPIQVPTTWLVMSFQYTLLIFTVKMAVVLSIGGVLSGLFTRFAWRNWP
jgi:hypothetical protein